MQNPAGAIRRGFLFDRQAAARFIARQASGVIKDAWRERRERMDQARHMPATMQPAGLAGWLRAAPVAMCFVGLALLLIALHLAGATLNGDLDDLLKAVEVRHLVDTLDIFDRTLPGIAQPEPYVTHWPWIVDAPYALPTALLAPMIGQDAALSLSGFVVPLLLLWPALYCLHRLIGAAGFARNWALLPVVCVLALRSLFEFAPSRIDYHSLQIVLLLATLVLLLRQTRAAAFANGLLAALALAISLEFAAFYALAIAVVAWDFVAGDDRDGTRIGAFGAALALGGAFLYGAIVPPGAYGVARCDMYSMPHLTALGFAGLSLLATAKLTGGRGVLARVAMLGTLAVAGVAMLALLYPECAAGPYGGLSDYVRDNQLLRLEQEKSLLALPDFVLSGNLASMTILFVGALALPVVAIVERCRSRPRTMLALFALLALVQAVLYFRTFRYLPLFSAIGLILVIAPLLPPASSLRRLMASSAAIPPATARLLALPGLALSVGLVGFHLVHATRTEAAPAGEIADSCDMNAEPRRAWPAGARLLSPPRIGLSLLAAPGGPQVVAVPNHPGSTGIERAYRFLDPQTTDPHAILAQTASTHVAVCGWDGPPVEGLAERYPLAAALIEGRPPAWLNLCASPPGSSLRVYAVGSAACPEPVN